MAKPPNPDPLKIRNGRGTCRGCKRSYTTDKRGLIRLHWTDGATRKLKCVGAETLPLGQALADQPTGVQHGFPLAAVPFKRTAASTPERPPVHVQGGASMHDLVIEDMKERKEFGLQKYGTVLQAWNGRNPLNDGYQEVLDQAAYLKMGVIEFTAMRLRITDLEEMVEAVLRIAKDVPHSAATDAVLTMIQKEKAKRLPPWQGPFAQWPRE